MQEVRIPLGDNTFLVAEQGGDLIYKEIYIGIERPLSEEGLQWQDLAIVRQRYHHEDAGRFSKPVPEPGKYEVLVFGDENQEDYTETFTINQYKEESDEKTV